MKLQLLFIIMDLLTVAIIPFAFLLEKLRRFKKGLPLVLKQKTA